MIAHHNAHIIERAQLFTGSLILGAMFIAWAATAYLLSA